MRSLDHLSFAPFPEIRTERLSLRSLALTDAPEVLFLRSDDRVGRFLDRPKTETLEQAEDWIKMVMKSTEDAEGITWVITRHGDPTMIGSVAFWRMDKPNIRAEIGYVLHPDHWGEGIMVEAATAAID